jgi:hypothetical protein
VDGPLHGHGLADAAGAVEQVETVGGERTERVGVVGDSGGFCIAQVAITTGPSGVVPPGTVTPRRGGYIALVQRHEGMIA